jgi:hypothetical protein
MINLIFNTSRRINLFFETLLSLIEFNPEIPLIVDRVYILDHLSTYKDRKKMIDLCRVHFGDKVTLFEFNGVDDFDCVDKLNCIGEIFGDENELILLLDDDWKCIGSLDLSEKSKRIIDKDFDIVNFATPLFLQTERITNDFRIDDLHWRNPFPEYYNQPTETTNDGQIIYNIVRMNNFSLTPHLCLSSVYRGKKFTKNGRYETDFADSNNFSQVFTTEMFFQNIGSGKSLETHK